MEKFAFEKLEVYKKSVILSEELIKSISNSNEFKIKVISGQVIRAVTSISLNIAEGCGRYHPKEMKNFFSIARGSLNESVAAMNLLRKLGELSENKYSELYSIALEIGKMLSAMINEKMKRERWG